VIVAPERSLRPMALEGAEPRHRAAGETRPCPFCPGNEHDTPHEVFAIRDVGTMPDGLGWRLRVVPNMFPAVRNPDAQARTPVPADPLFASFPGIGRHEVVIESPEHVADPSMLSDDLFRDVFIAYRQRLIAHAADPSLKYCSVFKNVGAEAGASLGHCHSQIIAVPIIPDLVDQELNGSRDYHARTGRCVFCDLVQFELAERTRLVAETPRLVALAAYAGRFSHEVWILPKEHASRYEAITDSLAAELAGLMKRLVRSLDAVLGEPAYNWFLHAAPLRSAELPHYHWHFELMPRSSRPAGFEWGTGCYINAVAPETAAEQLRAALC
jgi:UDPglucose--hexose-1-phosphate uridylyltransferase